MPKTTVPAQRGPEYKVVDVTPALAEKWLGQNTHNRNLRERAVLSYARDMESGNWAENGETIKFAVDGTLLDGQHRLQAIALSGVTLRMLVVSGLQNASQETMDDGRKRSLADALHLRGETNATILGSILRRAVMWEQGAYRNSGTYTPTNTECLTFLATHPEARVSTEIASALRKPTKLPASVLGLSHWLFSRIDTEDAVWFFDKLSTGAISEELHPILALRRLARNAAEGTGRVPEDNLLACVIKAWNAYRDGDSIKLLAFRPGGANPEKFPMPK
jgi:hypothetical protein